MMDKEVAARLKDHEQRADELTESIRKAAAELFDIPYHPPNGEYAYRPVKKPYWVEALLGQFVLTNPGRGHRAPPARIAAREPGTGTG